MKQDLTGQTFGAWTVLRRTGTKHGHPVWLCRCGLCGREYNVSGNNLGRSSTKCKPCHLEERRKAMAKSVGPGHEPGDLPETVTAQPTRPVVSPVSSPAAFEKAVAKEMRQRKCNRRWAKTFVILAAYRAACATAVTVPLPDSRQVGANPIDDPPCSPHQEELACGR